jgi:hypothetical protein
MQMRTYWRDMITQRFFSLSVKDLVFEMMEVIKILTLNYVFSL